MVAACVDTPDANGPTGPLKVGAPSRSLAVSPATLDSLSRAIAIAMESRAVREQLRDDLRDSPFPGRALHIQSYLQGKSGRLLATDVARSLGMTRAQLSAMVEPLPALALELDRTLDRVRWEATPDVVVYGLPVAGAARQRLGPTTKGYGVAGEVINVPLWTAGPKVYLVIGPTEIGFGVDPEARRLAAPRHSRRTVGTRAEEWKRTMSPAARVGRQEPGLTPMLIACGDEGAPPSCDEPPAYPTTGEILPSEFTAGYCFGTSTEPIGTANDVDTDGIRDSCEYQFAYAFRPMLARNNSDDAPGREPYWSVTRVPNSQTGVRVFYAISYYRDGGWHVDGTSSHDGDSEFIIVELQNSMSHVWHLTQATLSAHWNAGSPWDRTSTYAGSDLEYPSRSLGRPRIWASWNKHANYRTKDACNGSPNWFDVCDTVFTGTAYEDVDVRASANLGNSFNQTPATTATRLINCVSALSPQGRYYGTECYWNSGQFFGWNVIAGQASSTPYVDMFSFFAF